MAAAAQSPDVQTSFGQHALRLNDVLAFAVVAGAHQRHLFLRKPEVARAICLHKRQGLKRLEGGACKSEPVRIARIRDHLATRVDDGNGTKMHTFKRVGTVKFDKRGEIHGGIVAQARVAFLVLFDIFAFGCAAASRRKHSADAALLS